VIRKPHRDPVTPALREYILSRDKRCFATRVEPEHRCRDRWGILHRPDALELLTLDHVKDAARIGLRAPSDARHLVAMCFWANVNGWASAHRNEERAYLAAIGGRRASETEDKFVAFVDEVLDLTLAAGGEPYRERVTALRAELRAALRYQESQTR